MWIAFAIAAAFFFGLRGILYQRFSRQGSDRHLTLLGVFLIGFVISLIMMLMTGHRVQTPAGIWVGLAMGLASYLGNMALYRGFATGKTSLVGVLAGTIPLFTVVLAFFIWNERLSGVQLAAFLVICVGIYMIHYSNGLSLKGMKGAEWGLVAAFFFAMNDLLSKQSTLLHSGIFASLTLMFASGSLMFAISWWHSRSSERGKGVVYASYASLVTGVGIGIINMSGVFMILNAFKTGKTGLVSALTAMSILVILTYSRLILKETFVRTELAGIILSLMGIVILRLGG
ncbi:DMT family transporter [Gynuella sunshinyii]|uniref:Putative membrane protein n=1 Tax=Gynuella sunshinyii YC6258 TaxID=1445510 RepID=A0A0C5W5T4_9GAMM|nr:DMT family transporter [Gynuella sunshinyii]AJQ97964.1 putative membrane protein [Gynuella sunshinyii YC6258]